MVGDPSTGFLVGQSQTFPDGTVRYSEYRIGGTSLSCPLFAGVIAVADQLHGGSARLPQPQAVRAGRHLGVPGRRPRPRGHRRRGPGRLRQRRRRHGRTGHDAAHAQPDRHDLHPPGLRRRHRRRQPEHRRLLQRRQRCPPAPALSATDRHRARDPGATHTAPGSSGSPQGHVRDDEDGAARAHQVRAGHPHHRDLLADAQPPASDPVERRSAGWTSAGPRTAVAGPPRSGRVPRPPRAGAARWRTRWGWAPCRSATGRRGRRRGRGGGSVRARGRPGAEDVPAGVPCPQAPRPRDEPPGGTDNGSAEDQAMDAGRDGWHQDRTAGGWRGFRGTAGCPDIG